MLKYVTIVCLGLLAAIACEKSSTRETNSIDNLEAKTGSAVLTRCTTTIVISTTNSTIIDSATAAGLYLDFKERIIKNRTNMDHQFCKEKFRYLKYGLFLDGTLKDHLCIDESSFISFAGGSISYDAIRLYPCLYRDVNYKKQLGFLFVFTKGSNHSYNDSYKYPVILFKLQSLKKRICDIWIPGIKMKPLNSHRLCTPNCPNDDDLLADY